MATSKVVSCQLSVGRKVKSISLVKLHLCLDFTIKGTKMSAILSQVFRRQIAISLNRSQAGAGTAATAGEHSGKFLFSKISFGFSSGGYVILQVCKFI